MKIEKQSIINLILIVVGTLLLAFGTAFFLLPNELICGGISGIAIIFGELFPYLSQSDWINFLTIGLFVLGVFTLKSKFAIKTLLSTAVYPFGISLFSRLSNCENTIALLSLLCDNNTIQSFFFAAVLGGILVGAGCAITFLGGGSTGGVDIVALLLSERFPNLQFSFVIFVIDASIILCGIVLYGDVVKSLFGVLSAFIASVMIKILYRKKKENN